MGTCVSKMPPASSSPIFVLSLLLLLLGAVATQSEVSTPFFEEDAQFSVSPDNNQRLSTFDEAVQPKQNEETQTHAHPMPETIGVSPLSSWSSWLRTIFINALGLRGFDINAPVAAVGAPPLALSCSGSLIGSECLAWQAFFDATGPWWRRTRGGCSRDDPCSCAYVTCYHAHIIDMQLGDKSDITGSIPNSISALTALTYLQLGGTSISGSIPDSISALTALYYLDLGHTGIGGSIPQSFCSLDLSDCELSVKGSPIYACPLPNCTDKLTACGVTSC